MKKLCVIFLLFVSMIANAQIVNIPDVAFKARLLTANTNVGIARGLNGNAIKIDINNDGEIQETEALLVYQLNVHNIDGIQDITGISAFTNLRNLTCSNNDLTSADLSALANLETLNIQSNNLTSLNIAGLIHLVNVNCSGNNLNSLNTIGLNALNNLNIGNNDFLTFNVEPIPSLLSLDCPNNAMTSIDLTSVPNLTNLYCNENNLSVIDLSGLTSLLRLECQNNPFTALNISSNINLTYLNCSYNSLSALNLSSNTKLTSLNYSNNSLSALNLAGLGKLEMIKCSYNQLTSLVITDGVQSPSNIDIDCSYNQMVSLDISGWTHGFSNFICSHNQLTSLNLVGKSISDWLDCSYNQLSTLTSSNKAYNFMYCNNNLLTYLNVSNCNMLEGLNCSNNLLTTFDGSSAWLYDLNCSNNQLISLFLKSGTETGDLDVTGNPDLQYICMDGDDLETDAIMQALQLAGNTTCEVNSYCLFTPGAFYTIQGQHKYDIDSNGCGGSDPIIPSTKLNITNGTVNGIVIDDESGNYSIRVQGGTHIITPVLASPYYQVSPPSFTVTFPGAAVPSIQDFCITSDGDHPDTEISIIPGNTAVPGFNAHYTLRIRNKGTIAASGTVQLAFDGAVMDFDSASPTISSQSANALHWNYSNLPVFGTQESHVIFSLNTPTDTPPLNQDDILPFTATVNLTADETPADNVAVLNQMVFNALDPNDKTCLEGDTITPEMVGEYVHYMIRFENTGNYPAQNVTVKDVIDTSKFDISTLMTVTGSHSFVTRINNTNQVEFVFDNIMLPFDDANNDGYVVFKIKTKPTLVLGDELSNTAGIYFNYNPPVVTNTAVTTVAIPLGINENENTFGFALYPNPVKEVLNISSKTNADIDSVVIYNTLGQEVMKVLPALGEHAIDVSKLSVGHYVVRVTSETVSWDSQFIKE